VDVTRAVTHDGYHAQGVDAHEKAWLNVWITTIASGRSRTCTLLADGNGSTDKVKVWVHN
jgi:hypothetical protein